jgi:hypothetical protein
MLAEEILLIDYPSWYFLGGCVELPVSVFVASAVAYSSSHSMCGLNWLAAL